MQIAIKNINFGYNKQKQILRNININVSENKTIAIVGASGCGKSTLLRLICGVLQKTKNNLFEGTISINNETPANYTQKGKLGFMFQEPTLFPNLTVEKNIELPNKFHKNNTNSKSIIEKVGLTAYKSYLPSDLSGGMKTRVALARTFITKPELLLLDEPFGALDIKWKFTLYRELESLIQEYNPMVILVTHDINEALLLSNHVLVFSKQGTILKEILIDKPLPRVFEENAIKDLQREYLEIQHLIMTEDRNEN